MTPIGVVEGRTIDLLTDEMLKSPSIVRHRWCPRRRRCSRSMLNSAAELQSHSTEMGTADLQPSTKKHNAHIKMLI